ncbi:hypothetical protein F5Y12DRAFT_374666 [Xylaria sp. FL1777]|nr:hypothetical protein F5Y12DRAFT_374666 [Xylaria sp. FL1777]
MLSEANTIIMRFVHGSMYLPLAIVTYISTRLMGSFPRFRQLPKELQIMIWKWAIYEEGSSRAVLLDSGHATCTDRVMPTWSLLSPIMSANHLSRQMAMEVYMTKLDVLRLREPSGKAPQRDRKLPCGPYVHVGYIFLSLQLEEFHINHKMLPVIGCVGDLVGPSCRWETLTQRKEGRWDLPTKYITSPLSSDQCSQIQKLRETDYDYCPPRAENFHLKHCNVRRYWTWGKMPKALYNRNKFPHVKSCWRMLIPMVKDIGDLIFDLSTLDGRTFYKKWEPYSHECKVENDATGS